MDSLLAVGEWQTLWRRGRLLHLPIPMDGYKTPFRSRPFVPARRYYAAWESLVQTDTVRPTGIKSLNDPSAYRVPLYRALKLSGVPDSMIHRTAAGRVPVPGLYQKYSLSIRPWEHRPIDTLLRREINAMFAADQAMRARYYRPVNYLLRPLIGRQWRALNARQVARIVEITRTRGFPGEKLIGIDRASDHPKVEPQRLSAGMAIVILLHHYSHPNPSHDALWRQAVARGEMAPRHFGTVADFQALYGKSKYAGGYGYTGTVPTDRPFDAAAVDRRRRSIGLLPLGLEAQLRERPLTYFGKYLY